MADIKERLSKEADALVLNELKRLTDAQFNEVMKQLMQELRVEPRKVRNKPSYYFTEVVSMKDQKREILFLSKDQTSIGIIDVEKLATYAEKVRAPRSILMTLGDISRDAEKEARKRSVLLINGSDLANLIRKAGIEDMILKDFAMENAGIAPLEEDATLEGQMMLGVELIQAGDYARSLEHFDRAIASDPESEIAWRLKGNAFEKLGQHTKALECYARALEINPQSAELWYSIGQSLYSMGRYAEEMQAYDNALAIDPRMRKAWGDKGATLLRMRRYDEALVAFNKAVSIDPNVPKEQHNRGLVLKNLGKYDDALESFDLALGLNPDLSDAWLNKGAVLIQLGRLEESLACFEHLVLLRPELNQAWSAKGEIESQLGKREDAIESFEVALELDPTSVTTKKLLDAEKDKLHPDQTDLAAKISSIFAKAGAKPIRRAVPAQRTPIKPEEILPPGAPPPEALQVTPEEESSSIEDQVLPVVSEEDMVLLSEEPGEPVIGVAEEVFGDAAELMLMMKRPEIALSELEKGLRLEPISIRMLMLRGMALHNLGRTDDALKILERAVDIDPSNNEVIYSIEYLLNSQGKYGEAEEALQPILDGKQWAPEILAAMDSAAAGKIKNITEHLEVAVSLEPSAIAWNYKGLLDLEEGDFEKAIEVFDRARELEEVFSDPSNNMGVAYFKLGVNEESGKYYDLAVSSHPRNSIAWSNRGVLLASLQRYKEAITCFDQSLLLKDDYLVQINRAFTLLEMDQLADAVKGFNLSLALKETPEGCNDKGIALARMKKFKEAVECFDAALKLSPEFEDATRNLEEYKSKVTREEKKHKGREEETVLIAQTPEEVWEKLGEIDEDSLNKKKKSELVQICEELKVSPDGTKKELIDRIMALYPGKGK